MRTFTGIAVLCSVALLTMAMSWLWGPVDQPSQAAPSPVGYLKVSTNPSATNITIDGQSWKTPPEIPVGRHTIQLSAPGYAPVEYALDLVQGQTIKLRGSLEDLTPPTAEMAAQPTLPTEGDVVTVQLDLADRGSGLAEASFLVDDLLLHTETLNSVAAELELRITALPPGLHRLTAVATDAAGNSRSSQVMYVDVQAAGPVGPPVDIAAVALPPPGETVAAPPPVDLDNQAETAIADPNAGSAGPVVSTPAPPVTQAAIRTETLIISTYGYTGALDTTGSRPRLDANQMAPPQPQAYQAVILENDALRLTVLPELGGRLYQIIDKATGQKLLYNNPVIKPTRWGPEDMTWWLAVGGIEWAYPVHEHGYAWADTWEYTSDEADEGAALTLTHNDAPTGLQAQVRLFLPAQGRHFTLAPSVTNLGDAPAGAQLWLNAAFRAGPNQRLELPAAQVKVHSAGEHEGVQAEQILPWQPDLTTWGRWNSWFSAFPAPATNGILTVSSDGQTLLQRSFNPAQAPGVKWFTWGPSGPVEEWEGQPYFEVWGGLTSDFETYINLQPGETRGWEEMWSVSNDN